MPDLPDQPIEESVHRTLRELVDSGDSERAAVRKIVTRLWTSIESWRAQESAIVVLCELESQGYGTLRPLADNGSGYMVGYNWARTTEKTQLDRLVQFTEGESWYRTLDEHESPECVLWSILVKGEIDRNYSIEDGMNALNFFGSFENSSTDLFWIMGFIEGARVASVEMAFATGSGGDV